LLTWAIHNHPLFPKRTNFEVAHVINPTTVEVRVWERGAGETLACGSGACAVAVAGRILGLTSRPAELVFDGNWLGEKK